MLLQHGSVDSTLLIKRSSSRQQAIPVKHLPSRLAVQCPMGPVRVHLPGRPVRGAWGRSQHQPPSHSAA
jgi:hypothetical protein